MAKTEAQIRATRKWENENYDKVTVYVPKGIKEQIKLTGSTYNSFILEAINEKLERDGK